MKKVIKIILSFLTTILGIGSIYFFHMLFFPELKNDCLIAAFGAAAVLAFSIDGKNYPASNVFLGSIIGSGIGVWVTTIDMDKALLMLLAIGICVVVMEITQLKYPPGGAMCLIPISTSQAIQELGYFFILSPVLTGVGLIFLFSKIQKTINNKL